MSITSEEFAAIKMRVQQGLMGFEAAMDHMFERISGNAVEGVFISSVVTNLAAPATIEPVEGTNVDTNAKTAALATAAALNLDSAEGTVAEDPAPAPTSDPAPAAA